MRDCFRREFHLQKETKAGEPGTKRRKYTYFEQMLYLIPQTQDRVSSSNYSPMTVSNGDEDTDEWRENEEGSNDGTVKNYTCRKKHSERNTSRKINYEQQLLDIPKEMSEHTHEDKTFLLSPVPGFKKLDDDQKCWAKMEMLGIMRRSKNMVFQPQYAQL
jgi:hypothetical protein